MVRSLCRPWDSHWPVSGADAVVFQGMSISVLGPTFGDLASNVRQSISNISYIFVGRSAGYMGGSVVAGFLFDIVNHHLLLGKPPCRLRWWVRSRTGMHLLALH